MTLEDIEGIFNKAAFDGECQFGGLDHRAGIRAVVEALRDVLAKRWTTEGYEVMNEILASDGVKGTHGSPELDEDARKLEAMGQDAGPTVQDLFPEVFVPAADRIEALEAEVERLRAALEEIASGRYSGLILPSYPPQDPAVVRARKALEDDKRREGPRPKGE